jgi:purine-binding chemotaxis protein CheW
MKETSKIDYEDDLWDEEDEDTQKGKYLTFSVDEETFGIEIIYVIEIIGLQKITRLPEVPKYVKGMINLRGNTLPVIDVRLKFGMEKKEYTDRTCIIVTSFADELFGFIVDNVDEVLEIPEDAINISRKTDFSIRNDYIKALGKVKDNIIILLDIERIISQSDLKQIVG